VLLIAVTTVLYYIPIRYLIMGWGINKFTRKIIRPHTIPNNELLDLLSRVPDNEEKVMIGILLSSLNISYHLIH